MLSRVAASSPSQPRPGLATKLLILGPLSLKVPAGSVRICLQPKPATRGRWRYQDSGLMAWLGVVDVQFGVLRVEGCEPCSRPNKRG